MTDRRDFLRRAVVLALGARFLPAVAKGAPKTATKDAAKKNAAAMAPTKLALLVIGNGFAGTSIADSARRRGHDVTIVQRVTRGDAQKLKLDRKNDLEVGENQRWDAVIDTSARIPMEVELLESLLRVHTGYYLLLSSTAVYAELPKPGADESTALAKMPDRNLRQVNNENASALLVLCEKAAAKLMPDQLCIVRAGLLVGPGDPTGRFTYWPMRVARGGDVLAPDKPTAPVQFIDVRDLADFAVLCAERKLTGTFNADGPPTTIGALLDACRKAAKSNAHFVWVDTAFIEEQHLAPYRDLPVWAPAANNFRGFGAISSAKAKAAGLKWRPVSQTVADTLAWFESAPEARAVMRYAGLAEKREADLLKLWHKERSTAPVPAPERPRRARRPSATPGGS